MEVRVFKSYDELSKAAALEIIKQVKENPKSILGFATGSSPIGLYKELRKDFEENKTSYSQINSFNLDEYYGINRNHTQSYYNFMQENLFKYIDINQENINIPSGFTKEVNEECELYTHKLEKNPIDIQILGIGGNGHIGFNEPGTPFDSNTHYVKLDDKTRKDNARFFSSIDEVPTHAVTMGIANILKAKKIILIATGNNKADAVYHMVKGTKDVQYPASALQDHPNVIVFIDDAAAIKL